MTRILFFDVETRKSAQDLRPDDKDAGFDALRRGEGGASAIVIYDTLDKWVYTYDDNTMESVARHLEAGEVLVGFRSSKFDLPCIEGLVGRRLKVKYHYDISVEIHRQLAVQGKVGALGENTLDAVSRRNLGRGKVNHGSNAKELSSKGRFGELFYYCSDDVHLTKDLFKYICTNGGLIGVNKTFLPLQVPQWIKEGMVKE